LQIFPETTSGSAKSGAGLSSVSIVEETAAMPQK